MGMGHLHLRKLLKRETMYKDKSSAKHKCMFERHYILKVTDRENRVQYFNVMKCGECLSFRSIPEEGNIGGYILQELTEEQKKFPVINAFGKHYFSDFADLENVSCSDD